MGPAISWAQTPIPQDIQNSAVEAGARAGGMEAFNQVMRGLGPGVAFDQAADLTFRQRIQAQGAGGNILFVIQMGMAIDQFGRARTDRERGYAAANAAASVATYFAPPIGAIAQLVITAVGLADGALEARSQQAILEIHTRILAHQQRIMEIHTQFVLAEYRRVVSIVENIRAARAMIELSREALQECTQTKLMSGETAVEDCVRALAIFSYHHEYLLDQMTVLANVTLVYSFNEQIFANQQLSRQALRANLPRLAQVVDELKSLVRERLTSYARVIVNQVLRRAEELGSMSQIEIFKRSCQTQALNLVRSTMRLVVSPIPADQENRDERVRELGWALDEIDSFTGNGCLEQDSEDDALNQSYQRAHTVLMEGRQQVASQLSSMARNGRR